MTGETRSQECGPAGRATPQKLWPQANAQLGESCSGNFHFE